MPNIDDFTSKKGINRKFKSFSNSKPNSEGKNQNFENIIESLTAPHPKLIKNKVNKINNQFENNPIEDKNNTVKNWRQTEDKVETNWRQTEDKVETNWRQTEDNNDDDFNKLETNWRQTGDKSEDKLETKLETEGVFNNSPKITNLSISSFVGIQREIIFFIFQCCKNSYNRVTEHITMERIKNHCRSNISSLKKSLQRLEKKGAIVKTEFKNGRGGWSRYKLSKKLFEEIITLGLESENWRQTGDKTRDKLETNAPLSSSINIINKTTTTETKIRSKMSDIWQKIDWSLLANYGFTENHLFQLSEQSTLEPEVIQDSLDHFAFDLNHNDKLVSIKVDAINFIMGILTKGRIYTRPPNYVSPEEEAMRAYLEAKEQERKRSEGLQQQIQDAEFESWHLTLSDEDLKTLIPTELQEDSRMPKSVRENLRIKHLRTHFTETIWPEVKRRLFNTERAQPKETEVI